MLERSLSNRLLNKNCRGRSWRGSLIDLLGPQGPGGFPLTKQLKHCIPVVVEGFFPLLRD